MYVYISYAWNIDMMFMIYLITLWDWWINEATVDLTKLISNKSILVIKIFIYAKLSLFCFNFIYRFVMGVLLLMETS